MLRTSCHAPRLYQLARRASTMAQRRPPPAEPLVVVMGSTGTGKSELAVELAARFDGEVINADAVQMYRGSPIITNKIPVEEQRSIPHHLLGTIGLEEEPWTVGLFKREANKIIREIRSRGRLPIVVGGTHYYLDGLLFDNHLVEEDEEDGDGGKGFLPEEERSAAYPILDAPTEVIWKKLKEVDPVMASRWHPNNRRKIQRSLEIFLSTGRRASEIYAEQEQKKASRWGSEKGPGPTPFQSLLFWVYTGREALNARLDRRVDKMVDGGLLAETTDLFRYVQARSQAGEAVNLTKGIWQSIGFKQFEPYVKGLEEGADPSALEQLKQTCIESTKTATRQYAKSQIRWITRKTLPLLQDEQALKQLYLLDSTDVDAWPTNVAEKAATLTRQFLQGEELPEPTDMSETAREVLASTITASSAPKGTPCHKTCELCRVTAVTEERWQMHLSGHRHRRAARHAKRTALVPVEAPKEEAGAATDRHSSPVPTTACVQSS